MTEASRRRYPARHCAGLRQVLDYALAALAARGTYTRILLKAGTGFRFRAIRLLKIDFEFARGLLRRSLQIERAHEFAALVHEIDDPGVVHRIVAGLFARHLF